MRIYFGKLRCDSETCICHWKWTDSPLITCYLLSRHSQRSLVECPGSSLRPQTQTNSHYWNFWILTYYGRAILVFYTENKHKTVQGKDQSTKVWLSNYHNLTFFGNLNAHAADSPCLVCRKRWTLRKQHPLLMHLCKSNRRRITAVLVNRHGGRGVTFAAPMLS